MATAKKAAAPKSVASVDSIVAKHNEQGFRGIGVDPTDDHAYSVAGVTSGAPTPETDPDYRDRVRDAIERQARAVSRNPEQGAPKVEL